MKMNKNQSYPFLQINSLNGFHNLHTFLSEPSSDRFLLISALYNFLIIVCTRESLYVNKERGMS